LKIEVLEIRGTEHSVPQLFYYTLDQIRQMLSILNSSYFKH